MPVTCVGGFSGYPLNIEKPGANHKRRASFGPHGPAKGRWNGVL
tara:strand:- start:3830 stop:3961 length:132 start_codon:yes stop_codon:yes gene_type:complete